jgi:hypothetical protein
VQDTAGVTVLESASESQSQLDGAADLEGAVAVEPSLRALSLDEFHHHDGRVVLPAHVVNAHYVRVVEARQQARLALETDDTIGPVRRLGHLERYAS